MPDDQNFKTQTHQLSAKKSDEDRCDHSNVRSTAAPENDPTVATARLMATLYYFMAKEVIETLGEEKGREIIRRAVWKFGFYRGAKIREAVDKQGLEPNLETLVQYYDLPASNLVQAEVDVSSNNYSETTRYCTFAEVWKAFGAEALGLIYCEQDFALAAGFNEEIKCERPSNMMEPGSDKCRLLMKL